jgi:AAA15 family ATPase/GTPase
LPQNHNMINELNIQNFRLFEHFQLKGLKRVNLFVGKNNSGKTALLEALRIMYAGGDDRVMGSILQQRGEFIEYQNNIADSFFNRTIFKQESIEKKQIRSFIVNNVKFIRKFNNDWDIEYQIYVDNELVKSSVLKNIPFSKTQVTIPFDKCVYIPFDSNELFPLSLYWDKIVLTPKEDNVKQILKETILPKIVRLNVNQERILVRLEDEEKPIPLKNLGDGAQRMLFLAVALVNAKDNALLIDEIETGLHYSLMEKTWEIIFKYAQELNIQVFVTTHSQDALIAYNNVLERAQNKEQGAFFRLQPNRKSEQIEAIAYDVEELELALEANLDPR